MKNNLLLFILLLASSLLLHGCYKISKAPLTPNFLASETNQAILDTQQAIGDSVNITRYLEVFSGKTEIPNFTDSMGKQNKLWLKCNDSVNPGLFTNEGICWFRLTLRNTTPDAYKRLLCFSNFDRVELIYSAEKIERAGELLPLKDWSYNSDNHCIILELGAKQKKTYGIKCYKQPPAINRSIRFIIRSEQNERSLQSVEIRSRMFDTVFLFFFLGFLSFCFIYFLAQFIFRLDEKILLVYSLYILFSLLYSFRDVDKHYFLQTEFTVFNGINIWGEAIFSYLSYIFYLLFVVYLLDLKSRQKWAYRLIIAGISIITLLLFSDIMLRLSGNELTALTIFRTARTLLFPLVIVYFALIIPLRGGYYSYFLTGSVFLVLGAGVNLLIFLIRDSPEFIFHNAISSKYGFWGNTVNYTRLGVILEVLFFSLGLSRKMQMAFVEATLREDSAIENRFHTHEVNAGLTTLRSKLGNEQEAEAYLVLFNKYLRKALELMKYKNGIELTKEIEMARAYFILRQEDDERFKFYFDDNKISTDNIFIPAGLLIPFIQNFFQHAVTSGFEQYKFAILLYKQGKKINLDITDNGKGIDTASVYNKSSSSGLDIARRKINLFNSLTETKLNFTIGNNTAAQGTLITITNLPKRNVK